MSAAPGPCACEAFLELELTSEEASGRVADLGSGVLRSLCAGLRSSTSGVRAAACDLMSTCV